MTMSSKTLATLLMIVRMAMNQTTPTMTYRSHRRPGSVRR